MFRVDQKLIKLEYYLCESIKRTHLVYALFLTFIQTYAFSAIIMLIGY